MPRIRATLAATFLSMVACGDADVAAVDPLVGRWTASTTSGTLTLTTTLTLDSGNTMTVTDAGRGTCSGSRSYTGLGWSKTASTITFSGTSRCSGEITCGGAGTTMAPVRCPSGPSQPMNGACSYALSGDMNLLTLSNCSGNSGSSTTYERSVAAR